MEKKLVVLAVLLLLPCTTFATGGGGIEYFSNVGPDLLPSVGTSSALLPLPTGQVAAVSGFGYGITPGGWKLGGFGLFFYGSGLSVLVPGVGQVSDVMGWFAGAISGGQARLGPFRLSLNLRLGGGMVFADDMPTGSLYGSIDGELGFLFVPAMMVSAYAGVGAIAPILLYGPVPMATFVAGLRITWGSF